jgi:alpha-glucosidase
MDSDDQEMVNFYHRVIKKAAEHHLLVDFHGAYKPTGLQRTYPNYITQEGVMGNEYNKWSSRVTPEHNLTIPFTRMLAGPMDFTPGGFRQIRKENFKPQDVAPFVMGTRAHQLAMMVVYESPLQVLCDSPYNYRNQPGLEFLKIVPTSWDETRVLNGQVGEFITIARKSGDRWFLGGMSNSQGRVLEIPLNFLGEGRYQASIFADAPDSADFPERLKIEKKPLTSKETLKMNLAPEGGFAIALISEK